MTLRFDAGAAESLWNTLGQALTRLELELDSDLAPHLNLKPHGSA